ncbi:hypothetical protein, partial [Arthrobacter ramosus]
MNDGHHRQLGKRRKAEASPGGTATSAGPRHMRRKSRRKSVILISATAVAATVALAAAVAVTYVGAT